MAFIEKEEAAATDQITKIREEMVKKTAEPRATIELKEKALEIWAKQDRRTRRLGDQVLFFDVACRKTAESRDVFESTHGQNTMPLRQCSIGVRPLRTPTTPSAPVIAVVVCCWKKTVLF